MPVGKYQCRACGANSESRGAPWRCKNNWRGWPASCTRMHPKRCEIPNEARWSRKPVYPTQTPRGVLGGPRSSLPAALRRPRSQKQAENSPKTTTFGASNGLVPQPKPTKARSFETPLDPKDPTRRPVFGFGLWDRGLPKTPFVPGGLVIPPSRLRFFPLCQFQAFLADSSSEARR